MDSEMLPKQKTILWGKELFEKKIFERNGVHEEVFVAQDSNRLSMSKLLQLYCWGTSRIVWPAKTHFDANTKFFFWYFEYICSGTGILESNEGKVPLKSGDLICFFPCCKNQWIIPDPDQTIVKQYFWVVTNPMLDYMFEPQMSTYSLFHTDEQNKADAILAEIRQCVSAWDFRDRGYLSSLVYSFFTLFLNHVEPPQNVDLFDKILLAITRSPQYFGGINQLAEIFHLTPRTIFRMFKKRLGIPPGIFINDQKLERSVRFVRQSDLPISLIAEYCGFQNAAFFSRMFKRKYGVSPMQDRKKQVR